MHRRWSSGLLTATLLAAACAATTFSHQDLLFAWASAVDRKNDDFLAVIDLRLNQIVATVPLELSGTFAHHTDYAMPSDCSLITNDFHGNRSWFFDLCNPLAPKVRWSIGDAGPLSFAHSFARLPDGKILATLQRGDYSNTTPGGLAEFSTDGRLLRWSSADPLSAEFVRPSSLAIVPKLDRIVTITADMGNMPGMPAKRAS